VNRSFNALAAILEGFVAFVAEHRRRGELDGGFDDGPVWLTCDCEGGDRASGHGARARPASDISVVHLQRVWRGAVQAGLGRGSTRLASVRGKLGSRRTLESQSERLQLDVRQPNAGE
jgi:hypothetical protein